VAREQKGLTVPKLYVYQRAEYLGIPVTDGTERVFVTVTNTDIVKAKKVDSKGCALSRATMRLPGVNAAYFFRSKAFIEYDDRIEKFDLPPSVQKEIVSFDRAHIFASGVYQLTPPAASRSNEAQRGYHRKRKVAEKKLERAQRKAVASAKSDLTAKIKRIASREPVNDTPEQRAFNLKVAGIMGSRAPMPLKPETKYMHRSQYVRTMNEPK
jgi:hypothetical protein